MVNWCDAGSVLEAEIINPESELSHQIATSNLMSALLLFMHILVARKRCLLFK